jgi:glycosyltransferase involved in cell wall biosynthesis
VGIPVFRDVRFLDACVTSVIGQEQPPHEILLVDDGSASTEVDAALAALEGRDGRVRVLQLPHRGVCVARNAALEAMTGDAFVFVDADDLIEPDFIARCAEMLRSDDRLWAVSTWTRFFGSYEAIEAKPPFDRRVGVRENPIISTAVLVDMSVRDLGIRFAPDLAFLFCEDWHFWSQITAAGGAFGLVPHALAHHRVHPSSGGYLRTDLAMALGRARAIEPISSTSPGESTALLGTR